jgi:hypothetical protein
LSANRHALVVTLALIHSRSLLYSLKALTAEDAEDAEEKKERRNRRDMKKLDW